MTTLSTQTKSVLIRIEAPFFVAGVEVFQARPNRTPPILGYMQDWGVKRILHYAKSRNWKAEIYWKKRYEVASRKPTTKGEKHED